MMLKKFMALAAVSGCLIAVEASAFWGFGNNNGPYNDGWGRSWGNSWNSPNMSFGSSSDDSDTSNSNTSSSSSFSWGTSRGPGNSFSFGNNNWRNNRRWAPPGGNWGNYGGGAPGTNYQNPYPSYYQGGYYPGYGAPAMPKPMPMAPATNQ